MAKAKSGGTRSYLRGRIANDVYSIGKDAKGKKQQVVRSLAESVANPQTIAQMRGRMIMSTVMQAVASLAPLVDHSFDNVPNGQPSISEFIRRNYALVKADVAAHPASGGNFALSRYQVKGIKPGHYVVSAGSAILPANLFDDTVGQLAIAVGTSGETATAKQIRDAFGISEGDFLTAVGINADGTAAFYRLALDFSVADETVITAENIASLFTIDNPLGLTIGFVTEGGNWGAYVPEMSAVTWGIIFSQKVDAGYAHSNTTLRGKVSAGDFADDVLPTYPEGSARFLNGGEL